MRKKTQEFLDKIGTDTSGRWVDVKNMDEFTRLVVDECILAVERADRSIGRTTYDRDVVDSTIYKAVQSIQTTFKE